MTTLISELSQVDRNAGGARLSQSIAREEQIVSLPSLDGLTFSKVLAKLNTVVANGSTLSSDNTTTKR